jgi:DNA-binding MarR family transcriptional regulator
MERSMDDETAGKLVALTTDLMMVFGRMKRAARPGDVGPVHPGTEFAILDTIIRHDCKTVPEIANWRGVTRQSVQEVVNRLLEKETLGYAENPSHKSSKRLQVTPAGHARYLEVKADMTARYGRFQADLQPGDVDAAVRVMRLIADTWETKDETGLSAEAS